MSQRRAIIIGAGPAGLTAAYELLSRTGIRPVVLERSDGVGGISRTVNFKGNRMDLGGHRFFSKSDRVMEWWLRFLPLDAEGATPASNDRVMLLRPRRSRIYYLRRFFDYPLRLNWSTLANLGKLRTLKMLVSYARSALFPLREEKTLEQFLINRFGRELYQAFFQSYTEKVWGVPCSQISADWGAQRIKGLSAWSAILHAIGWKNTEPSLIGEFLYPKLGPGQMWEEVARRVLEMGGEILTGYTATRLRTEGWSVAAVEATRADTGTREVFEGDYFFSSAPVKELVRAFDVAPPPAVFEASDGLQYRDFITVGLLVRSLKIHDDTPQGRKLVADNWIYVQEPDVRIGRLQIFNNWSPHLVADPNTVWLGLEYFCDERDHIWSMPDEKMADLAKKELGRIGIIDIGEVLDWTVIHVDKAYPAYFGSYDRFAEIRAHLDRYVNLFLVGRNGMHRYNNQDHSVLTSMIAVDNIIGGEAGKANLWEVNAEPGYCEER